MLNLDDIRNVKHIVIILPLQTSIDTLACANALYSYILTLHKKVSIYSKEIDFGKNLYFLPWMGKLKNSYPSSADLEIKLEKSEEVFEFFQKNNIKLNSKMATSLYAALLAKSEGFTKDVSADDFAFAELLVRSGADIKSCTKNILNYNSLAALKLKSILFGKMILKEEASLALFELEDEDLKSSGAKVSDIKNIVKDTLSLPTVNSVIVKYKNEDILKEGNSFEKKT